jgi:hypothetical protein
MGYRVIMLSKDDEKEIERAIAELAINKKRIQRSVLYLKSGGNIQFIKDNPHRFGLTKIELKVLEESIEILLRRRPDFFVAKPTPGVPTPVPDVPTVPDCPGLA